MMLRAGINMADSWGMSTSRMAGVHRSDSQGRIRQLFYHFPEREA